MSKLTQAIIRTGGKQYRVEPNAVLRVEKLEVEVGTTISLTDVLLVGQGDGVRVGTPLVQGASVQGTVVSHGRGPRLIVYKFKRRKNQRKKKGHRQAFTELRIDAIEG